MYYAFVIQKGRSCKWREIYGKWFEMLSRKDVVEQVSQSRADEYAEFRRGEHKARARKPSRLRHSGGSAKLF